MLRQKQSLFLLLACCLLLTAPTRAQDAIFTSDVVMDETGTDAADAKAQAMKKAERKGLDQLLAKLAPEQKDLLMGKLRDEVISAMVKSVEVQDEKIAGNTYRATLKVSYNALAVDALIGAKPEAEKPADITSTSVLVIPVYEEDGKVVLWEPTNPWRDAWKRAILELPGGNVLVPYGDSADTTAATTESIQAANFAALGPFFARYGVGEVVIVRASFRKAVKGNGVDPDQPAGMSVVRRDVSPNSSDTLVLDYRADPQEDKDALLLRAAHDIIAQVNRSRGDMVARQETRQADVLEDHITIIVPTTTMDAWTQVRGTLMKLQTITRLDMVAMSPQQVDAKLEFKGTKPLLAKDIASLGLRVQQYDTYWVVSRE